MRKFELGWPEEKVLEDALREQKKQAVESSREERNAGVRAMVEGHAGAERKAWVREAQTAPQWVTDGPGRGGHGWGTGRPILRTSALTPSERRGFPGF